MLHADARLECARVFTRIEAEYRDAAFVPFSEAFDALHGRGLAGPVGSDEAEDLPSVDLERDVRYGDGGAVPFLEVRYLDDGIAHACLTGVWRRMFMLCSVGGG